MEKRQRQIFSKIVRASKLTRQRTFFAASCSRMNSPVSETNRFLMVSFLIRVNILKQLFTSGSVNIVE